MYIRWILAIASGDLWRVACTNLIKFWLMRDFPFIDFVVHHGKGDLPCLPLYPFAVILMLPACAALRCDVQTTAGYDDFRHWLLSTMA